jgi:hypothetical protein
VVVLVALTASLPSQLRAQGNLSTQGLGYPTGQLSTPAISMGGAIGEADPFSPLNPAALGLLRSAIIFFQAEPEYRSLTVAGQKQRSSVSRFPVFVGGLPLGGRWVIGLSASTLLDRTWETTIRDTQVVGGQIVAASVGNRSEGSIEDVRLALSYAPSSWLRIGVGGHAFTGGTVLRSITVFDDSLAFLPDTQRNTLSFGGNAVSVGAQTVWPKIGSIGVSYRHGGSLQAFRGNTTVGSGSAPDHVGVSLVYLGITGTSLAVRAARDAWENTRGIAQTLNVNEGWDIGVGADVTGPRFGSSPVGLRAGGRWRTLPFSPTSAAVKERTFSLGFGFPMARGAVELHVGALRATRTTDIASETAWTISTGFAIRP